MHTSEIIMVGDSDNRFQITEIKFDFEEIKKAMDSGIPYSHIQEALLSDFTADKVAQINILFNAYLAKNYPINE